MNQTDKYLLEVARAVGGIATDPGTLTDEQQKTMALMLMRKAWQRGRTDLHLEQIAYRMARAERLLADKGAIYDAIRKFTRGMERINNYLQSPDEPTSREVLEAKRTGLMNENMTGVQVHAFRPEQRFGWAYVIWKWDWVSGSA